MGIAVGAHTCRYLLYIISGIYHKSCCMMPVQDLHERKQILLRAKARPHGNRQFLAFKILHNGRIFYHQEPGDRICPAILPCHQFHFILVSGNDQHIFHCKSHLCSPKDRLFCPAFSYFLL